MFNLKWAPWKGAADPQKGQSNEKEETREGEARSGKHGKKASAKAAKASDQDFRSLKLEYPLDNSDIAKQRRQKEHDRETERRDLERERRLRAFGTDSDAEDEDEDIYEGPLLLENGPAKRAPLPVTVEAVEDEDEQIAQPDVGDGVEEILSAPESANAEAKGKEVEHANMSLVSKDMEEKASESDDDGSDASSSSEFEFEDDDTLEDLVEQSTFGSREHLANAVDTDIIAVQGFGSNYERTWTRDNEEGKPRMWLRDFLPLDLPDSTIYTFEYASRCFDNPDLVHLIDCGRQLLNSLIKERTHHWNGQIVVCPKKAARAIIMIGHSYGGLVIKQALTLAYQTGPGEPEYDACQSILRSTCGIVFLGTPHRGSIFANFGYLWATTRNMIGLSAYPDGMKLLMVEPEKDSNDQLETLQDVFSKAIQFGPLAGLKAVCFWETKPTEMPLGGSAIVVTKESACLDFSVKVSMAADHKNMNKFRRRQDDNYQNVLRALKVIYGSCKSIMDSRKGLANIGNKDYASQELKDLKTWLSPSDDSLKVGKSNLSVLTELRKPKTCEWLQTTDAFFSWFDQDEAKEEQNTLWIYGKHGSGKSVMSAYLYHYLKAVLDKKEISRDATVPDEIETCCKLTMSTKKSKHSVLYYSFSLESSNAQNTQLNCLTNLIYDLLMENSDNEVLRKYALDFHLDRKDEQMTAKTARSFLIKMLQLLSTAFIIIDGLDECVSKDRDNLFDSLEAIQKKTAVRFIFLSRQEGIQQLVMDRFCSSNMALDIAKHNSGDISAFVNSKMKQLIRKKPYLASVEDKIVNKLKADSIGMFIWVKVTIDLLEKQAKQLSDQQEQDKANLALLDLVPTTLEDGYQKTLNRLWSELELPQRQAAKLAFKWMLCATRPLQLRELRMILLLSDKVHSSELRDSGLSKYNYCLRKLEFEYPNNESLKDYFSNLLGSSVDIRQATVTITRPNGSNEPRTFELYTIHPYHTSFGQFLSHPQDVSSSGGVSTNWQQFCFKETDAHEEAAKLCLETAADTENFLDFFRYYYDYADQEEDAPFLRYAYENWDRHLRLCRIPYCNPSQMTKLCHNLVRTSLQISMSLMIELADALTGTDIRKGSHLFQLVAFRDVQAAVPRAMAATDKADVHIEKLLDPYTALNEKFGTSASSEGPQKRLTFSQESALANGIDEEYNTAAVDEFQKFLATYKDLRPYTDDVDALNETARRIRALTIQIAVEPVRRWLYRKVGQEGIMPLPVFAHTCHILDIYTLIPFLPEVENNAIDLNNQFVCDSRHVMYGFIHATSRELVTWCDKSLGATFYQRYIMPHFKLPRWEWTSSIATMMMLEYNDPQMQQGSYIGDMMRDSLNEVITEDMRFPIEVEAYMTPASRLRRVIAAPDSFPSKAEMKLAVQQAVTSMILPVIYRVIVAIAPAVEVLFIRIFSVIVKDRNEIWRAITEVKIRIKYTLIGVAFFGLRCYYFQWFGRSFLHSPVADTKFVLNDPIKYKTSVIWSWKRVLAMILSEMAYAALINFFKEANYIEWSEQTFSAGKEPEDFRLRIWSRRVGWSYRKFWDFVFLERKLVEALYVCIDLIQIAGTLFLSSTWSTKILWRLFFTIIQIAAREFGQQIMGMLFLTYSLGYLIWRYLYVGTVVKFLWSVIQTPLLFLIWNPFTFLLNLLFVGPVKAAYYTSTNAVAMTYSTAKSSFLGTLARLDPRITAICVAAGLLAFLVYLTLRTIDPMQLKSTRLRCCQAGSRIYRLGDASTRRPALKWASHGQSQALIPLEPFNMTQLVHDDDLEEEELPPMPVPQTIDAAIRSQVRTRRIQITATETIEGPDGEVEVTQVTQTTQTIVSITPLFSRGVAAISDPITRLQRLRDRVLNSVGIDQSQEAS